MLYQKNKSVVIFEQDNEGIAQMEDGTLHILNTTAYEVYLLCDGNNESDIVNDLTRKYASIERDIIQADVSEILATMLQKNIIVSSDEDVS